MVDSLALWWEFWVPEVGLTGWSHSYSVPHVSMWPWDDLEVPRCVRHCPRPSQEWPVAWLPDRIQYPWIVQSVQWFVRLWSDCENWQIFSVRSKNRNPADWGPANLLTKIKMNLNPLDFFWIWLNWYVYQYNLTTSEHFIDRIEFFLEIQYDQKFMDGPGMMYFWGYVIKSEIVMLVSNNKPLSKMMKWSLEVHTRMKINESE